MDAWCLTALSTYPLDTWHLASYCSSPEDADTSDLPLFTSQHFTGENFKLIRGEVLPFQKHSIISFTSPSNLKMSGKVVGCKMFRVHPVYNADRRALISYCRRSLKTLHISVCSPLKGMHIWVANKCHVEMSGKENRSFCFSSGQIQWMTTKQFNNLM